MGLKGFCGVDSNGMSGGLALYWREDCVVEILDKKDRFIDTVIRVREGAAQWRATFVYGGPHVENIHLMWTKLQNLKTVIDLPWLVIGDFNEAMWDSEHFLVTPRAESQMIAF